VVVMALRPEPDCEFAVDGGTAAQPDFDECGAEATGYYLARESGGVVPDNTWQPFSACDRHRAELRVQLRHAGLAVGELFYPLVIVEVRDESG